MATVKKSMKKAAPKKAMANPMMKAPSMGGSNPMMKMGGKVSKVTAKKYKSGGSVDSYTDYAKTSGKPDSYTQYKMGGTVKAKDGKSFPDLNKDGKITKADILKGRGVIAKSGAKMKIGGMHKMPDGSMMKNSMMKMGGKAAKQAAIAIAMKKDGVTPKKKMQYGGKAASMKPTMKMGGKCKNGC